MNEQLLYFTYGLLIYIPASALISVLVGQLTKQKRKRNRPARKPQAKLPENLEMSKPNKEQNKEEKTRQEKELKDKQKPKKKVIPEGKFAFCKYCDVHLENDDFFYSHEVGKKHQKNFEGRGGVWYKFVDPIEAQKAEMKKNKPQKMNVKMEAEEGWTQILKQNRKRNND